MSIQNVFDRSTRPVLSASDRREMRRPPPQDRRVSKHLVTSLATGLRATYEAAPDSRIPEAFHDLIARLHAAEDRRG